jgi:hypothetical protein
MKPREYLFLQRRIANPISTVRLAASRAGVLFGGNQHKPPNKQLHVEAATNIQISPAST